MTVEDDVQDMKPLDAVEYLLDVIRDLGALEREGDAIQKEALRFGFTACEARTWRALRASKSYRDRKTIHSIVYAGDPTGGPLLKNIDARICLMRAKLDGTGWRIVNKASHGWKAERA